MSLNYPAFKKEFGNICAAVMLAALTDPKTVPRVSTYADAGRHPSGFRGHSRARMNHGNDGRHLRKYRPTARHRRIRREMQVASRRANRT